MKVDIAKSLEAIKDIEMGSEIGKMSLYFGIVLVLFMLAGNIQFTLSASEGLRYGKGVSTIHILLLIFYYLSNITLSMYFINPSKSQ